MAIKMNTYAGAQMTAKDDGIWHDVVVPESGILQGCNMTLAGTNQIHIDRGYIMIRGRYCTVTEDTIQLTLSNTKDLQGRLYVRADLSDTKEPVKILSVASDPLPDLQQDENFNFENGVYELELATYTAGLANVTNFVQTCGTISPAASKNDVKKVEAKMGGLTLGQGADGKWGYRVGGADPVIPFKTGEEILPEMIKHQDYTIPSERFLLELVGYRNMYSQSSGINRYALNGADVEKEIGRYFCAICNSGYSCVSGNVGVLKLICRGTPGNKIAPVVYFNESNGAKGDAARMINWIVTMTPLMEE